MNEHQRRTCLVCRNVDEQRNMLRFCWGPKGVEFDAERQCRGRGVYLHRSAQCWSRAADIRLWQRAFGKRNGDAPIPRMSSAELQQALHAARGSIADLPAEGDEIAQRSSGKIPGKKAGRRPLRM